MKKRWWISVILASVVTVSIVLGIFWLSQKESEENQVNDVVKINESLYMTNLLSMMRKMGKGYPMN